MTPARATVNRQHPLCTCCDRPQSFQRGQETLALADEAQRQLEASADNLTLHDQQAAAGGGTSATQVSASVLVLPFQMHSMHRGIARKHSGGPVPCHHIKCISSAMTSLHQCAAAAPRPPGLLSLCSASHPLKQALAALQQLQEYESAMGAGEEAEEAARAEEGVEAVPAGALTDAAAPMKKSRSQHATAVLTQNLAELATSEPEAQPKASPNGVEPQALVAHPHRSATTT